jgi:hypothetical protein
LMKYYWLEINDMLVALTFFMIFTLDDVHNCIFLCKSSSKSRAP